MKTIDLQKQFKVIRNEDAGRWEFNSIDNNSVSYTVSFIEAETEADAYISVWKAIKKIEQPSQPDPYTEIGKSWKELCNLGYETDVNVLAVMHELQQKFKP